MSKDLPYAKGAYNKYNDQEQWIRITEGCKNNCEFCRETKENGEEPRYLIIPDIVRNKVKIMDMNLTYKPKCIEIMDYLGGKKVDGKVVYYELICGIDYRSMNQEKANAMKKNRFIKIRLAWDHSYKEQKRIKNTIKMLKIAGYNNREITVFIICNWKRTFEENMKKMELCKVWGVKIADCYFDNQLSPNIKPNYWNEKEIKEYRKKTRKHNQLVNYGIDPEYNCEQEELF